MASDEKQNVTEIRKELHKLQMKLNKMQMKNRLATKYKRKVSYMLMWLRLITVNKELLEGWGMPDLKTINNFRKELKTEVQDDE